MVINDVIVFAEYEIRPVGNSGRRSQWGRVYVCGIHLDTHGAIARYTALVFEEDLAATPRCGDYKY